MTDQATLTVQFSPFRLTLLRDNDGAWHVALRRIGDEPGAAALVSCCSMVPPAVVIKAGVPVLDISSSSFAAPVKQMRRVHDWLEGLKKPVVGDTQESAVTRE